MLGELGTTEQDCPEEGFKDQLLCCGYAGLYQAVALGLCGERRYRSWTHTCVIVQIG